MFCAIIMWTEFQPGIIKVFLILIKPSVATLEQESIAETAYSQLSSTIMLQWYISLMKRLSVLNVCI